MTEEAPTADTPPSPHKDRRRLLVLSDMHLGRDCNEITGFEHTARPNPEFDQAFVDLLDFYTVARENEWRIIFAGDFIDFIELVVVPGKHGPLDLALSFEVTQEEKEFGLGTEAERVVVKLKKTLEYHNQFFRRLSQFIREGGEVSIMRGNHDVELFWPKVQRVFRRKLAKFAFDEQNLDVDEAIERHTDFQGRVSFVPWVYIEPGRVYIEHGHQYDVYCSFDHQLYPISPTNPRRIDTPVSAFAMRYFVNMLQDFAAHHADVWSAKDYVAWLKRRGLGGSLYIIRMAIGTSYRMLLYAARFTMGRVRRYGKQHNKRLADEAEKHGVSRESLTLVDALHHLPVSKNLPELMRLLFLDRILLVGGALALTLLILLVVDNTWIELVSIALTAFLAVRANKWLAPRRYLLPGPKQAQAAKKIADLLEVPLVVMGHSHMRRVEDIGEGRRYINTGCWLPPLPGKEHVDVKEPCNCRLSHLVVEDDDQADLRVFCRAARTVRLADVQPPEGQGGDVEQPPLPDPVVGMAS